ncbi:MAG: ankyrin repeat domain-containing protein, partial [Kiritimatiellia bacterium]|nr:ankyrin repeat domain-containing protein [Kiritimatiellia bacterium]
MRALWGSVVLGCMLGGAGHCNELFEAVMRHDEATVRRRLEAGDNPNRVGRWNNTPLEWAVVGGQTDVARLLIAHGADPRTLKEKPLFWSAKGGLTEYLAEALADGADPNVRDRGGQTPLMRAAAAGQTSAVELLLAAGAKIDAAGTNTWDLGQTALFHAAMANRLD